MNTFESYPLFPFQTVENGENIPSFRRVNDAKICLFCKHCVYDGYGYACEKHEISIADKNHGILMAEFSCDEWEKEE